MLAAPGRSGHPHYIAAFVAYALLLLGLAVVFKQLTGSSTQNLRDYLLYALAALLLIRLSALLHWGGAVRRRAATETRIPHIPS